MKLAHVIQAVYNQRWVITEAGFMIVHERLQPHIVDPHFRFEAQQNPDGTWDETTDLFGQPIQQYSPPDENEGVAIVPIKGTLLHHAGLLEKQCGACSYDDIRRDVNRALDDRAEKIVLDIDSPGGMCMGCMETGRVIAKAAEFVPVVAVTDSLMCSGAYWLASQADKIFATQTAEVGSIGVITAFMDQSERYKMAGVKPVVFTSGDLKGTGFPGTSLSEAQSDHIKKDVAHYFSMFRDAVLKNRLIEDDSMRGQTFTGDVAFERGLIDKLVDDIEECFEI